MCVPSEARGAAYYAVVTVNGAIEDSVKVVPCKSVNMSWSTATPHPIVGLYGLHATSCVQSLVIAHLLLRSPPPLVNRVARAIHDRDADVVRGALVWLFGAMWAKHRWPRLVGPEPDSLAFAHSTGMSTSAAALAFGAAFFATLACPADGRTLEVRSNSVNCTFSVYEPFPVGEPHEGQDDVVFVKFADPTKGGDDVTDDAVIGALINRLWDSPPATGPLATLLAADPGVSQAFMSFRAAFPLPPRLRLDGVDGELDLFPAYGALVTASAQSGSRATPHHGIAMPAVACVSAAVAAGRTCVAARDCFWDAARQPQPAHDARHLEALLTFFRRLAAVSEHTKFVHNDCHDRNLLYDATTSAFTLIDYGRAHMDFERLPAGDVAHVFEAQRRALMHPSTPPLTAATYVDATRFWWATLDNMTVPAMCDVAAITYSLVCGRSHEPRPPWSRLMKVHGDSLLFLGNPKSAVDAARRYAAGDATEAPFAAGMAAMVVYLITFARRQLSSRNASIRSTITVHGQSYAVDVHDICVGGRGNAIRPRGTFVFKTLQSLRWDLEAAWQSAGVYTLMRDLFAAVPSRSGRPGTSRVSGMPEQSGRRSSGTGSTGGGSVLSSHAKRSAHPSPVVSYVELMERRAAYIREFGVGRGAFADSALSVRRQEAAVGTNKLTRRLRTAHSSSYRLSPTSQQFRD